MTVTFEDDGSTYETDSEGVNLQELAVIHYNEERLDVVLAQVNGKLRELTKDVKGDSSVRFLTIADKAGMQTYRRSAILLMLKAVRDITRETERVHVNVTFSINHALYCELISKKFRPDQQFADRLKKHMRELVNQNIPIYKKNISTDEAIRLFESVSMKDKQKLFMYRRVSRTNVYYLGDYVDYFYGYMLPSTGYITDFDVIPYEDGFMLVLPDPADPGSLREFTPQNKLFTVLNQSQEWGRLMDVPTVGSLNDLISRGEVGDLVLVQEALMEKNIGNIAGRISSEEKKVILIAGPSSSGKTTFSHRLSVQLRANGLHPHPISMDNYFVEREQTPRDSHGNYDFECIEALDIAQFNEDIDSLLKGRTVQMPEFNFVLGKREYKGKTMKLGKGDVLVIEGIHGLNPKMTEGLSESDKFRIYISALTQLNIDEHNRIPTTDGRLIRRIVRDSLHRGTSARETIAMWPSVRRGEEKNIFPFQEHADAMFNSALIYELAVLKQYAEPMLFAIDRGCPEYNEAKRLLKFFDYFLPVGSDNIPQNSIIREFIGGSCFNV